MPCPEKNVLKAYLTPAEYESIKAKAGQARLSVSKFVQTVCLGFEPKSKTDHKAILAMLEVNRDLSRLGNLLKLAIAQETIDEKQAVESIESIAEIKELLKEKVKGI